MTYRKVVGDLRFQEKILQVHCFDNQVLTF